MAVELLKLLRKISSESGDRLAYVSDSGTLTYREFVGKIRASGGVYSRPFGKQPFSVSGIWA